MEVNPSYSSIIGNLQHDYIDSINSAIEIGRRGYLVRIKKVKRLYPEVKFKETFLHRWKKTGNVENLTDWKEVAKEIKNMKVRYRVSLEECKYFFRVFRSNSIKSKVQQYCFT